MTADLVIAISSVATFLVVIVTMFIVGRLSITSNRSANEKLTTVQQSTTASMELTQVKLDEIHELVNSRLTTALAKIDKLELRIQALTGEKPTGEPPASG